MKKTAYLLACLALLSLPLATISPALAQATAPDQTQATKPSEFDQLKKEIEELRAKIKSGKESIEPALAKLKADRERMGVLQKRMKELREERREKRKKWREENRKKNGPAPASAPAASATP